MKKDFHRAIQIGLILVSSGFIVVLISHIKSKNEVLLLETENRILVEKLEVSRKDFEKKLKILEATTNENNSANVIELHPWDIEEMKRMGLKEPVKDIISDLMQHRELIPYEGSLGGTMNFYSKKQVRILTKNWVLAYFEDGHNGGHLFLEYEVTKGVRINWKVLASYIT